MTPLGRLLVRQHIAATTPPLRQDGNPVRAAFLLVVALVVLIGGSLLTARGCG